MGASSLPQQVPRPRVYRGRGLSTLGFLNLPGIPMRCPTDTLHLKHRRGFSHAPSQPLPVWAEGWRGLPQHCATWGCKVGEQTDYIFLPP